MTLPTYDESKWPRVTIVFAAGSMTDAEFEEHLSRIAGYHHRGSPFAIVLDLRVVLGSSIQKNVLTAILWLAKPKNPMKTFNSLEEARTWANAMVHAVGQQHAD